MKSRDEQKEQVRKYVDDSIGWKSAVYPEQPVVVDYETVLHLVKTYSDQTTAALTERNRELELKAKQDEIVRKDQWREILYLKHIINKIDPDGILEAAANKKQDNDRNFPLNRDGGIKEFTK